MNPVAPPPGYVDPTAFYSYVRPSDGTTQSVDQRDNPANYAGWKYQNVSWMYASNPQDYPSLVESANRSRYRDISQGFTWQGFFLNGDLVPTFGWRKDVVSNYQTNALTDPNTGFTSLNFPDATSAERARLGGRFITFPSLSRPICRGIRRSACSSTSRRTSKPTPAG